jgi:hypothetical protein
MWELLILYVHKVTDVSEEAAAPNLVVWRWKQQKTTKL